MSSVLLADRTYVYGRVYGTKLCMSVCDVEAYVLWLNGML